MATTPRVALIMTVVGDLGGSGGSERLFSRLHEYLRRERGLDVALVTARSSLRRLQAAGRGGDSTGVIALDLGEQPGRGRMAAIWMTLKLLAATVGRFDVVHICLPSPVYAPYAAAMSRLPRVAGARVTLTVVDCTVAPSLAAPPPDGTYERQVLDAHRLYARWVRLDGTYTWYRAFIDAASQHLSGAHHGVVRAARYCFTEPARFTPAAVKEPVIVFAGRLSVQKRPLLFVDAIQRLRERDSSLLAGWRVEMYGLGVLEREVRERIARYGLDGLVRLTSAIDLAPVLSASRLFVSTQALENFTSLAMLEAMAAGNAVIAEDVGQTREFVRDTENGYLVNDASPDAFAAAIERYLRHPGDHERFARASRRLATSVHTVEHFADDILAFWRDVIAGGEDAAVLQRAGR
jgi:glycosyltransferase involved in cell wall biosynthesis